MGAQGEKLIFFRRAKNRGKKVKKINSQILMEITPGGTKLHILHDSDTESHFSLLRMSIV